MRTFLFTIFLIGTLAHAQVGLTILDETERGFSLGVNGFLQNGTPLKHLHINGLDTIPTVLTVWQDSVNYFEKTIHFHQKGDYKYVLTENSRGTLQLRYRGEGEPPTGAVKMKVARVLKMEEQMVFLEKPKKEVSKIIKPQEQKPAENLPEKIDTIKVKIAAEKPPEPIKISPQERFANFIQKMKETDLEFERLNQSLEYSKKYDFSIEEMAEVLKVLKYDNTRLQFLRAVIPQKEKWDGATVLYEALDYEVSRESLRGMLGEN